MFFDAVTKIWKLSYELKDPSAINAYVSHDKYELILSQNDDFNLNFVHCSDQKNITVEVIVNLKVVDLINVFAVIVEHFDIEVRFRSEYEFSSKWGFDRIEAKSENSETVEKCGVLFTFLTSLILV